MYNYTNKSCTHTQTKVYKHKQKVCKYINIRCTNTQTKDLQVKYTNERSVNTQTKYVEISCRVAQANISRNKQAEGTNIQAKGV